MRKVAVYGPSKGNGSFARVAKGMSAGLAGNDAFAGFIPIDRPQDEWDGRVLMAPRAIYVGPPGRMNAMFCGSHERTYVLVAPNSQWVPENLIDMVDRTGSSIVVPSKWAFDVILRLGQQGVTVWPHAASPTFHPTIAPSPAYGGRLRLAHFSSSVFGRKGTRELLDTFVSFNLPHSLDVYVDVSLATQLKYEYGGDLPSVVRFLWPPNADESYMRDLYSSYDAVIQPSRGEAFGMVPLEARCCGRPAIMTTVTGHSEHADNVAGLVMIQTGMWGPLDDGPDSLAPSISEKDILAAIERYETEKDEIDKECFAWALCRGNTWTWKETTALWLQVIGS